GTYEPSPTMPTDRIDITSPSILSHPLALGLGVAVGQGFSHLMAPCSKGSPSVSDIIGRRRGTAR
ncbi:MAG: hypothetical protein RRB24_11285, partial [Armatimonadota bacterium]|nr:hypothetical protein [Armatimonadota bacterium]MDT7973399.1 hypothetical protein [Armatimonadota bacterium]